MVAIGQGIDVSEQSMPPSVVLVVLVVLVVAPPSAPYTGFLGRSQAPTSAASTNMHTITRLPLMEASVDERG